MAESVPKDKGVKRSLDYTEDSKIAKKPCIPVEKKGESIKKPESNMVKKTYKGIEDISNYLKMMKIGQGTFGEVYKAKDLKTNKVVALKKILGQNPKEGFPVTALREIMFLQAVKHENIVNLIGICREKGSPFGADLYSYYIVLDFCDYELKLLIDNRSLKLGLGEIKTVMKELLAGVSYLHVNKIIHRDIKSANILVTKAGTLKIADFGLSKALSCRKKKLTTPVVTLWYRSPELLLGEREYGPPIDMWSVGCIMAELFTREPLFKGTGEPHQLKLITDLCGSITPEVFPGCEKLPLWNKLNLPQGNESLVQKKLLPIVKSSLAMHLLEGFLTYDPVKRIGPEKALTHSFFNKDPPACKLTEMLRPLTKSSNLLKKANIQQLKPNYDDGQYQDRVWNKW